jgi:hypothetical protein
MRPHDAAKVLVVAALCQGIAVLSSADAAVVAYDEAFLLHVASISRENAALT